MKSPISNNDIKVENNKNTKLMLVCIDKIKSNNTINKGGENVLHQTNENQESGARKAFRQIIHQLQSNLPYKLLSNKIQKNNQSKEIYLNMFPTTKQIA
jgi:hypothetical protein